MINNAAEQYRKLVIEDFRRGELKNTIEISFIRGIEWQLEQDKDFVKELLDKYTSK